MSAPTTDIFAFRYTLFKVQARIHNGLLLSKIGLNTITVPMDKIEYVYVDEGADRDHIEMIICYRSPKGTLRRAKLFSEPGEQGFEDLKGTLLATRPRADISHLSRMDAYRKMGSKPMGWVVTPTIMTIGTLLVALCFGPMFIHGMAEGQSFIDLSSGALPDPASNDVVIRNGRLLFEKAHREATEREKMAGRFAAWVPVVGPDWSPGDPVRIILEFRMLDEEQALKLKENTEFEGVLRRVWWEGLDYVRQRKLSEGGLEVPRDVWLVEHGIRGRQEFNFAASIVGFLVFLTIVMSIGVWRRTRETKSRVS